MKLLDWLHKPTESGIEGAITDLVKLALVAIVGAVFNSLLARFPGLEGAFWSSKRFAIYQLAIWLSATAVAAVWITYSVMHRRIGRLERLTNLDPTTGLLNLRALEEQLPKALAHARDKGQPLTLIIFDIDRFKEVNTLVGHDRANVILRNVAELLRARAPDQSFRYPENVKPRSGRVTFRYGGDEFIILAYNTCLGGGNDPKTGDKIFDGSVMASLLQSNVWNMNFSELAAKRKALGQSPRLTVSAGIADTIPSSDRDDTAEKLRHRAELALIEAKFRISDEVRKDTDFRG